MIFNQAITNIIQQRHSVRTYSDKPIASDLLKAITAYIEEITKPYNGQVRIQLLSKEINHQQVKLGTYGVIKGAQYYLGGAVQKSAHSHETLGYVLEQVVLYCTSLGLGTVWLGGTFSRSQFAKAMNLQPNEELLIVVPVGYESDKKSFIASLMGNHNQKRKPFGELFFNGSTHTPLTVETAQPYAEALEMVRRAPSAINAQPWRVIKEGNTLHFYTANSKPMHLIDLGIGLAHFHLTATEQGLKGEFIKEQPSIECPFDYIASWHML